MFIIVVEALSREFRSGVPWELYYMDDLVVIADSQDECIAKLKAWKGNMEQKGLRINMTTKMMVSGVVVDVFKDSGKYPCAVCHSGIGVHTIASS